ncbi:luciferase family protein [Streptomyces sp. NPDC050534]|uniref:luciferase domain-containing protein n=1 Tax=Streptomyces sp. NPDC050534 TaxID=3365625 RepID=UPI0037ACBF8C
MTPAQRAMNQLAEWPDLSPCEAGCGTGRALRSARDEIVHFHSGRDVDLHLTAGAIQRLHYDFAESTAIRLVPGSRWVTVHLDCDADVDLLISLVSVALKAHQNGPLPAGSPTAVCNFHRVTVLERDADRETHES